MNKITFFFILLVLAACTPQGSVKINTSGIFKPFLFSIDDKDASGTILDYKEILLSDEPLVLNVQIYNDSNFPYTDIKIIFGNSEGSFPAINFNPSSDGAISFPGMDGNCPQTLAPKQSCLIKLILAPRDEKNYTEFITLKFKNYVDIEEHKATLNFLAGWPASLVFTNDQTTYSFGEKLGITQIPIVEREDNVLFTEKITMTNAGGLTARNILYDLHETCVSSIINHCPLGMFGAYQFEHNCPASLGPGETCDLTINYKPKNKNPETGITPEDIKEINYKSNLVIKYSKDPKNTEGALNAYFNSWSTNIQANFRSSVINLLIPDPLIVGNRESRSFRVTNNGYRNGELKYLTIRDQSLATLADCHAVDNQEFLTCSKNLVALNLAELPFTVKDSDHCLPTQTTSSKVVDVGESCNFEITFQPSTTFLEDRLVEYLDLQFELTFDARWKAQEKIEKRKLLSYSAQSKAAARLVVQDVYFGNTPMPIAPNPATVNLGRLALQSKSFTQRKPILISFKNIGSEPARSISLQDGKGQNIPLGVSTQLGTGTYKYFINVSASASTCTVIAPQDSCMLSASFAPIGLTPTDEQNQMYDVIDENDILQSFKEFRITYDSGSKYKDDNRVAEEDFITPPTLARIKAQLIRKGLLVDLNADEKNISQLNGITLGDEIQTLIYLRNIGTGDIPYIRLLNAPDINSNFSLIPTSSPQDHGADFDCLSRVDITSGNSTPYWPIPPSAVYQKLAPDKSCVFTVRHQKKNETKILNTSNCTLNPISPAAYTATDIDRFFTRSVDPQELWSFCPYEMEEKNFTHVYFDGDVVEPTKDFGTNFSLPPFKVQINSNKQANLAPTSYLPVLTATLLRPQIIYPPLLNTPVTAKTVPELWFFGAGEDMNSVTMDAFSGSTIFMRGDRFRNIAKLTAAYQQKDDYDYVYYIGSFPKEVPQFQFKLPITNLGSKSARFKSAVINNIDAAFTNQNNYELNKNINSQSDAVAPIFKFNPTVGSSSGTEEHKMEMILRYTNERSLSPLYFRGNSNPINAQDTAKAEITLKILVVGLIDNDYPKLTLKVNDIDVVQNVGAAPTETVLPAVTKNLSWNEHPATQNLTFDTIQLQATPKTEDSYAKKILTFTNTTSKPLRDLRIMFRANSSAYMPRTNKPAFVMSGTCNQGIELPAYTGSCQVVLFFQPTKSDLVENFNLTAVYETEQHKYVMQNIGIELYPRAPGQILAPQFKTELINYKSSAGSSTITRPSYPLEILGNPSINEIPTTISFAGSKKILLTNNEGTKSSLLLAYQRNLAKHSLRGFVPTDTVPVSTIPLPTEYESGDGGDYVIIHEIKYPSKQPRVQILATKGCLFGDDENDSAIPYFEKGFNKDTLQACYLNAKFYANFDYINKKIIHTEPLDMMNAASELWYYSVKRSSTSSLWFHFRGAFLPSPSVTVHGFKNVQPFDSKKVFFTLPKLEGTYPNLGDVVGVRILMSHAEIDLDSPYATQLKYKDFRFSESEEEITGEWNAALSNSQYVYFRAVAIRRDSRFVDSSPPRFIGLGPNEYLSATAKLVVPTIIPPQSYYFFHNEGILVQKQLANANTTEYANAYQNCNGTTVSIMKGTVNVNKRLSVINEAAWNKILEYPAATEYSNLGFTTHWLSDTVPNLGSVLGHLPEYDPSVSVKFMQEAKVLYMLNESDPTARIMKAKGGVPGGNQPFWSSYISESIALGATRCMATF